MDTKSIGEASCLNRRMTSWIPLAGQLRNSAASPGDSPPAGSSFTKNKRRDRRCACVNNEIACCASCSTSLDAVKSYTTECTGSSFIKSGSYRWNTRTSKHSDVNLSSSSPNRFGNGLIMTTLNVCVHTTPSGSDDTSCPVAFRSVISRLFDSFTPWAECMCRTPPRIQSGYG